jgi:ABC-type amino acid transport substrate-binding protein
MAHLRVTGAWGRLALLATDADTAARRAPVRGDRLEEIRERGVLCFGWAPDGMPWSYEGPHGEPLGLEADLAHALALGLGVKLQFVRLLRDDRVEALNSGRCDLSGGRIRADHASRLLFSRPFADERWAFLVRDHDREVFANLDRLRDRDRVRIALLPAPEYRIRLQAALPRAELLTVASIDTFLLAPPGRFDAMYTGLERGSVYSLLHPELTAVVPEQGLGSTPIALIVPHGENDLLEFVNAWLEEERSSGLVEDKLDYWVRGRGVRSERGPRWSIAGNLLGW